MLDILLVDDEPTLRLAVGDALRSAGHKVRIASDGAEALAMIAANRFACEHAIQHAVVLSRGQKIDLRHLASSGQKKDAADLLGISRKNLWEKLKHHGVPP